MSIHNIYNVYDFSFYLLALSFFIDNIIFYFSLNYPKKLFLFKNLNK